MEESELRQKRTLARVAQRSCRPAALSKPPASGQGKRLYNVNAQSSCFVQTVLVEAQNQQTEQRRVYRCQLADVERMWSLDAVGISAKETADEAPPEPNLEPRGAALRDGSALEVGQQAGLQPDVYGATHPTSGLQDEYRRARQADIRAAFHQIVLKEEDRRYVQFLWGDRHLRFQRVPFGVSCSPYMLLRTVCCHVRQCLVSQPELMQKVQGALYMDDLCPTFGTREEAAAGMKEVSSVFSKARMELHKTRTTDPVETVSPEADMEERRVAPVTRSHPVMQNVPSVETADDAFQATDFSDLGAAVNRIAWLKRFVHNARSPETERQSGPLSPEERREALVYWIREAQRRAFPEELRAGTRVTLALLSGEYFIRRRTDLA
ncbi:Retrovirus-related Pol polyprotein from transposon 412 [Amphibalanus amphitrite]|uniref:Retrovirus-related Pol polyprotein from transposon 412 n=1 Tax=Amphibalanus amphitrite TaxID=1232801 RepID=A0A6A4WS06_AMPAM|nr:Retrovirus-related Pol polyprotein from transposon 412 [Amphibalanus amphitrite]